MLASKSSLRHLFRGVGVGAALVAMLAVAGCQTGGAPTNSQGSEGEQAPLPPLSSLTPLEDPHSYEGPTTVQVGGPTITPLADNPPQELPTTVTSHEKSGDMEVTVTDASRVLAISITGNLADMVYSLGLSDTLIGRDLATAFPGSEDLPMVTRTSHSIDAESILALEPSLIITDGSVGPLDVLLQLRDSGVTVVQLDQAKDFSGAYDTARTVGQIMGVPQLGEELATELEEQISAKVAEIKAFAPVEDGKQLRVAFLYLRGASGIYYLFGEGSGIDTVIDALGAIDVATESGWAGMKPMTDEALVAIDPDLILVMTKGLESVNGVDGLIAEQPSIALTTAGKMKRIVDIEDTLILGNGTRIPDVLDGLARALYAPDSLEG